MQLNGGTISGGTVSSSGGTFYNAFAGTLDGTPNGGITLIGTLLHNSYSTTYLQGLINDPDGFTFDAAPLSNGYYNIFLSGDTELSGNGTTTTIANSTGYAGSILLASYSNLRLTVDTGHTLLSTTNVSGYEFDPIALTNNGTIQADGANSQFYLALSNSSSSNAGVIEATNGASVTLDNSNGGVFTNGGTVLADGTGSLLVIKGNGITNSGTGTIQANDGATVELQDGNFINNGFATAGANSVFSIGSGAIFDNTGSTPGSGGTLQPSAGGTI